MEIYLKKIYPFYIFGHIFYEKYIFIFKLLSLCPLICSYPIFKKNHKSLQQVVFMFLEIGEHLHFINDLEWIIDVTDFKNQNFRLASCEKRLMCFHQLLTGLETNAVTVVVWLCRFFFAK